MNIADKNQELIIELDRIAEVAGFLWQRNWAEANGGNISVNLTEKYRTEAFTGSERVFTINISEDISAIDGNMFFVTGAGKRMRDIARSPLNNGLLIRVSNEKQQIEIIGGKALTPTSELPSHL
ncbi:MAG TPA: class II aldolase/adducin family protein, partial [Bacteroidales bacterium]|nr:class II aldolase/adducin family protein [Bacteroidales bacterium]